MTASPTAKIWNSSLIYVQVSELEQRTAKQSAPGIQFWPAVLGTVPLISIRPRVGSTRSIWNAMFRLGLAMGRCTCSMREMWGLGKI